MPGDERLEGLVGSGRKAADGVPGHECDGCEAGAGHRRRRLPRLPPLRAAGGATATRCSASTTSSPAARANVAHLLDAPALRADAPRRDLPALRRGRRDLQPRLPGVARSTTSSTRCRRPRPACTARSTCWASPSGCGRRSSRPRPARSTATRRCIRSPRTTGATSTRSGRAPATTRASAAPRRCSSTTTASTAADQGRAHLQHLRPAHAPERRAGGVELHRPGAEGRADHPLRRRQPDPELLLRRRPDRGLRPADGEPRRGHRPDQPRQSRRVHHPRAGREGDRADRLALADRLPAAAGGRPDAAPARTSARRRRCSAGSRRWRWTRGWSRPSPISTGCSGRRPEPAGGAALIGGWRDAGGAGCRPAGCRCGPCWRAPPRPRRRAA